MKFLEISRFTT